MKLVRDVKVEQDGGSMTAGEAELFQVGDGLYRLDEELGLFIMWDDEEGAESLPRFGDVMRAEVVDDKTLRYIETAQRGDFRHACFFVSSDYADSVELITWLKSVAQEGGDYSRHMGGVLLVSIPLSSSLRPPPALLGPQTP